MKYAEIIGPLLGVAASILLLAVTRLVPPYSPPVFITVIGCTLAGLSLIAFALGVRNVVQDRRAAKWRKAREKELSDF